MDSPKTRHHFSRKLVAILCIVTLVVFAGGIYFYFQWSADNKNPYPREFRSKVSFKLYYPEKLGKDLRLDEGSFEMGENDMAILYTLVNDVSKTKYFVSIQEYPSDFDATGFKKKFTDSHESITPVGSVFIGDVGSELVASLRTTDDSWVLITSSNTAAISQLENLASSFRVVE